MYLGWNFRGRVSREYVDRLTGAAFSFANNAAICSAIDFETVNPEREKLIEAANAVGADFEQFIAQQSRAASAAGDLSLLFALTQHFIISRLGEWSGIPPRIPLASVEITKTVVSHIFIFIPTVIYPSIGCQELDLPPRPRSRPDLLRTHLLHVFL